MFEIKVVDLNSNNAAVDFYESFKNTGFAVIKNHNVAKKTLDDMYNQWGDFFYSSNKHNYTFTEKSQDGYFPFRSENAKDSDIKDLKEFFHVYPKTKLPENVNLVTRKVYKDLVDLGGILLTWIENQTPKEIKSKFSESLIRMIETSDNNLLRVLHYPPVEKDIETGAIRAAAHEDINLITLLVAGSQPGLEAQDKSGVWHKVPVDKGMITVNVGDMLQMASGGYYPSTSHRVVNPDSESNVSRFSMPMFLHPRKDVFLKENITADDYLQERLKQIRLVK